MITFKSYYDKAKASGKSIAIHNLSNGLSATKIKQLFFPVKSGS